MRGPIITLNHYELGAMRVYVSDEATAYYGERTWVNDNSDGICYDEGDFEETPEDIDALLAEAEVRAA